MDTTMDINTPHRSRHYRRRNNLFTYLDKSSSEPDLTEFNSFSSRWRKGPAEFITVDELKFYRRRRPPELHYANTTGSSFSLYNKSETLIPFSALKTEYQRQFCGVAKTSPRPPLRRRSTSLKLPSRRAAEAAVEAAAGGVADDVDLMDQLRLGESEQHAEYHAYTEDELSQCRRTLAHRPDHQFAADTTAAGHSVHFDGNVAFMPALAATEPGHTVEPQFASKHKTLQGGQHAAERCHLNLSGELSYAPEYRSQFAGFAGVPIEKSHSIPQISNIQFEGKFGGVAEYRDSFREYDRYARCAPIRNPGHLRTAGQQEEAQQVAAAVGLQSAADGHTGVTEGSAGAGDGIAATGGGEYTEKFQVPTVAEKAVLARHKDQFSLTPVAAVRAAGRPSGPTVPASSTTDIAPTVQRPERGRAKTDFLALKGSMDYSPEYRCTYLDHPRSRPITQKPTSSLRLGDHSPRHGQQQRPPPHCHQPPAPATLAPFQSNPLRPNVHAVPSDHAHPDLPFQCQPEVRRARQDLLLKKRPGPKQIHSTEKTVEFGTIGNALVAEAPTVCPLPASRQPTTSPRAASHSPAHSPLTFRLTVQNVDDPAGGTFKKTTPRFGRRSSVLVKESHRLRNRSRIVEGNRDYAGAIGAGEKGQRHHQHHHHHHHQHRQSVEECPAAGGGGGQQHSRKISSTSFVVLKDQPCKQSRWMKTSWYN